MGVSSVLEGKGVAYLFQGVWRCFLNQREAQESWEMLTVFLESTRDPRWVFCLS